MTYKAPKMLDKWLCTMHSLTQWGRHVGSAGWQNMERQTDRDCARVCTYVGHLALADDVCLALHNLPPSAKNSRASLLVHKSVI